MFKLPGQHTLRDYRNAIKPTAGFNFGIVEELKKQTSKYLDNQKFVVISFDEMKIKEDLVFDKYTGELVGFTDLGNSDLNEACFENADTIATHILAFHLRGISSTLKFCLAYFPTVCVKGFQIMPIFWEAVSILELSCILKVVAAVSDGASSNRTFFQMHEEMDLIEDSKTIEGLEHCSIEGKEVVYRTINIFASDKRYIWFFADAPHLMKTIRNYVYVSGTKI